MTAATFYLLALSFISSPLVSSVPVNKGKGKTTELAYGSAVDYAIAKSSYPFMARIILDGSFKCGGALISDRFVATARHCLEFCPCFNEANPSNDWTRCNKLCILKLRENSDFISDTETVHIIKTIHLPENSGVPYKTRGQRTDFALIELAESANTCTQEETSQGRCWPVTPVRLPDPFIHIKEGQRVRTLGWGATEISFGDEQSEFLAQLDITVNSSTLYHFLIETNIGPNGADPCKGDSGGPLLLRGDDLEWTLVGTLVGGGYACENPEGKDTTSDWNKVNLHASWITSVMGATTVDKPVTSFTTVEKPGYLLTSSGGAAEHHGHVLGLYDEIKADDAGSDRVFQQRAGAQFIYKKDDKWYCGGSVGASNGRFLYSYDLFSKPGEWFYYDGEEWQKDLTLHFLPLTPSSCILQPSIQITSTGQALIRQPDYLGTFLIVPDVFSAGRPVWRNSKGKVLKIRPGKAVFGVYYGNMETTGSIFSASGPTCPTDSKAGHSDWLDVHAWRYWDGEKNAEDNSITAQ